jgi:hypothetical protein
MSAHKYILEPYKGMNSRYRCPKCLKSDKTFTLYLDTETGKHIHSTVGRCSRESNCAYHYTPKQFFIDNDISTERNLSKLVNSPIIESKKKSTSFISTEIFKASLNAYEKNNFIKYLVELFGEEITSQLISKYYIGTSKHWVGATVFWQIDLNGKIRTGKIMLYNAFTGKRVKEPFNHVHWAHKLIKQADFELQQCLFGQQLLNDKTKPIAIVESEKTAIIASVYLPQFNWLAVGSLSNLNEEKCKILKDKTVFLFPDLNGFDKWKKKAKELSHLANFVVSDFLEIKASEAEKELGLDLADYLLRFQNPNAQPTKENKIIAEVEQVPHNATVENWNDEINALEEFFSKQTFNNSALHLNTFSLINNVQSFVKSHLSYIKENNGKRTYLPYLFRLQELQQVLINK